MKIEDIKKCISIELKKLYGHEVTFSEPIALEVNPNEDSSGIDEMRAEFVGGNRGYILIQLHVKRHKIIGFYVPEIDFKMGRLYEWDSEESKTLWNQLQ